VKTKFQVYNSKMDLKQGPETWLFLGPTLSTIGEASNRRGVAASARVSTRNGALITSEAGRLAATVRIRERCGGMRFNRSSPAHRAVAR